MTRNTDYQNTWQSISWRLLVTALLLLLLAGSSLTLFNPSIEGEPYSFAPLVQEMSRIAPR